ncbi:hypothetical protein AUK18_00755 [Candidatus Beckwithbacteria bacterium CG2_30_44_31]|uniref:Uncharacterized protein n=1 Tax=Candidatus Beckwithbacteria bacterium CG2_30_44_31 TaxID=1805035 RepID=A0A1J5AYB0_9BACT|nr:MAG: hypothetical protein AUK18_00755 [Candidatus Beckwithbacteria bacterium CG2_30_44_31]
MIDAQDRTLPEFETSKPPSLIEGKILELSQQATQLEQLTSTPFAERFMERNEIIISLEEKGKLRDAAYTALENIQEETSFFKPVTDLELRIRQRTDDKHRLIKGRPAIIGTKMRYKKKLPDGFIARLETERIGGPVIESVSGKISVEEIFHHILKPGSNGSLPESIISDLHENTHLIHYEQQERKIGAKSIGQKLSHSVGIAGGVPLRETIAWRTANLPFGSDFFETVNGRPAWEFAWMENQTQAQGYTKEEWRAAFKTIDSLFALGLSTPEITKILVENHQYDAKSNTFPGLQKEIETRLQQKNIPLGDLDKLITRLHLERKIERLKAVKIAKQTLITACQENGITLSEKFVASVTKN